MLAVQLPLHSWNVAHALLQVLGESSDSVMSVAIGEHVNEQSMRVACAMAYGGLELWKACPSAGPLPFDVQHG